MPYGPFRAIADVRHPRDARQKAYRALPKQAVLGIGGKDGEVHALRVLRSDFVGVTRLYLSAGKLVSTSIHNGAGTAKPGKIEAFWFCPGADSVTVSWKVRHPADIEKATLTVWAARLDRPISVVELSAADLMNGKGAVPGCTGGKRLEEVLDLAHGAHADQFPRGVLTVEHSPYRFELTIQKKSGSQREVYPSTAWTFTHVLVHSIALERGELAQLPPGPPPGVHAELARRSEQAERDLVKTFIAANKPLTDDAVIELDAPVFDGDYIDPAHPLNPTPSDVHDGLKLLWGEGPRIPLRALVKVRKADGTAATYTQSSAALGRVRLMWDWRDDPSRVDAWLKGTRGRYSSISRSYIDSVMKTAAAGPRDSVNCPQQYGGRRGAAAPVFQQCAAKFAASNAVTGAGAGRPWAAISEMGAGRMAHISSVLFTPGIIVGDQYKIAVYLTSSENDASSNRDDKPVLHVAEPPGKRLSDAIAAVSKDRRPPFAETGYFELQRRSPVLVLEDNPGVNQAAQQATVQTYATFAGLNLDVKTQALRADIWQVDHNGVPLDYDRLMAKVRNAGSLVPMLAFVRPPSTINAAQHLFAVRSLPELLDEVRRLLRNGGGYAVETEERKVGEYHEFGATETYLLARFTPAENPGGVGHQVLLVERGSLPPAGTRSEQGWTLGRWRRLCFGAVEWIDHSAAMQPEDRIVVEFTAAGLVSSATLNYERGKVLGRVRRTPPADAKDTVGDAIRRLIARLRDGEFESTLVIKVTARCQDNRDRERVGRAKEVVRQCLRERVELLDVEAVIAALMAAPYGNKNVPLDSESYWTEVKNAVKWLTIDLIERIRGIELPDEEGLIYLDITRQAAQGVFPAGGNSKITRARANPPEIWTTLFKAVGYQVLQAASTKDYALQAFCAAEDTMIHEFGHAFWRKHAPRAVWGFTAYAENAAHHVPHDTCLMNYDVDPGRYFCGRCVLALRGWKNLPPTDPAVPTPAQAIPLLAQDIQAETDARRKAWKQLRLAYLHEKTGNNQQAVAEISNAIATLGQRTGSAEDVSILRAVIRGYLKNNDPARARAYWRELVKLQPRFADLWDADGVRTPFFRGEPWKVEVVDAYGVAAGPVTQYVNLPRERRFVDGSKVTSLDRLGWRVSFKISFSTAGAQQFRYRLVGHAQDLPAGGNLEPGFVSNDNNYTVPVGPVFTDTLADHGSKVVQVDLSAHVRPGARVRLLVHHAASGACIESPELRVRQLFFYLKLTAAGAAQQQVFANDDEFRAALDQAYGAAGIEFIHLGSQSLTFSEFHYDTDKKRLNALMREIDAASDAPCATPFTPLAPTYAAYRPYLYVFTFVDTVIYQRARRRHRVEIRGHDASTPFSVRLRDVGAQYHNAVLWDGKQPSDLARERVGDAEPYIGKGVAGKEWLVGASFTPTGQTNETPLGVQRFTAAAADANYPGRLNRIDVDLGSFAGADGTVSGTLKVDILLASFQGGASVKEDSAHHNVAVVSTRPSYSSQPFDKHTQFSAAIHVIGHALGMVPTSQTTHFNVNGSGPHCWSGLPQPQGNELNEASFFAGKLNQASCVMFYRLRPGNALLTFCATCQDSLRRLDLSQGFR
ncbi:MAG TPA: hypothetical protein VIK91_07390 [Nannocystis sp.]